MSARRSKDEAEGLRILYVAMTRAEDRLVVVGARGRSNRPEGCHINRILHGLGFDSFPQPGDSIELEGVDARVQCVDPADVAAVFEGPRASSALETAAGRPDSHVGIPACPPFLAPVSAAVLPRSLSYSAISAFRDCPRRFYLERVLGLRADGAVSERAVSPPRDDDGADDEHLTTSEDAVLDDDERNAGRDVGLLVHGLLERSDVTGPAPSRDEVRRVAIDLVRQGMPALGFDAVERALDLALAFWRSPVVLRKGLSSARKEVPFSFSQGGMIVSGVMDLVWRDGESWFVVDYKTNSLAGRSAAEAVRSYELQACVYGLAALRAGARHVSMSFLFLEQPDLPVEHSFSVGDRNVLEAKMETVLGEIRDGDFASCGGKACARCRFERLCAGLICSPHSVDEGDGSSRNDGIQ
jgi:ATP-dependent exoDNAse (exonuclease V) beta subunit